MLIGFCGYKNSGKNTVSEILVSQYKYTPLAFADPVKDCISSIFGWNRDLLEGKTNESRQWREIIDEYWSNILGKSITPRNAMTEFGTDIMRNKFNSDIWLHNMKMRIDKLSSSNIIITDVRFPNEIDFIKKMNGKVFRVSRGQEPEWYGDALVVNMYDNASNPHVSSAIMQTIDNSRKVMYDSNVHYSEWAWIGQKFDGVIMNNRSIKDLEDEIKLKV